jgi:hypothetical protein
MAGTLTISTLSDGTNSTSATNCIQGSAKAWVNFNGIGTVAIRASYNVSSITDNGTGDYTVNLTTAMPNANYAINVNISPNYASAYAASPAINATGTTESAPTTSAFRFTTVSTGGTTYDVKYVNVSIFSS